MLTQASKCSSQMASFYLPQQSLQTGFFWLKFHSICIVLLKISFIFTSNLRFCCFSIFQYWKRNLISHGNKNFLKLFAYLHKGWFHKLYRTGLQTENIVFGTMHGSVFTWGHENTHTGKTCAAFHVSFLYQVRTISPFLAEEKQR